MTSSASIAMLFLAAGASRRMGSPKALLPWHGKTVIAHHFQTMEKMSGIDPWIVMRPDDQPLSAELDFIGWPQDQRAINPAAPDCEMIASIIYGIRAILEYSETVQTIGIALLDQVLTLRQTFNGLEKFARENTDLIIQPEYKGRQGHPVLFPRRLAEELIIFNGESLRDFLHSHSDFRAHIDVDDKGVVRDMDTPEEYQKQLLIK